MKTQIPFLLIIFRLVAGPVVIGLSLLNLSQYSLIALILLTAGLLSDIFDGIIARKLNVSTQALRRWDSAADQVFFISIAIATFIQHPDFFKEHFNGISLLLSFEAMTYVVSYLKFRKEIATHSIGAKIWALILFFTLVQVIASGQSPVLFQFTLWIGIITRVEIIAIVLVLKEWTNDVPTVYHSIRLRKGLEIKRNKMFNG